MLRIRRNFIPIIIIVLLVTLIVIIGLTLTGPAIGNIFTNAVNALNGGGSSGNTVYNVLDASAEVRLTSDTQTIASSVQTQERIIIRNASLSLTVADPEEELTAISALVNEMGGWVVNSSISRYTNSAGEDVASAYIIVRVPAERLDAVLESIKGDALAVGSENVSGQDVTAEYVDLSSRLTNLEAAETQLQAIMDTAETVQDVLDVHTELTRIRGDIESIRGQLQYYEQAAAFSSIRIDLSPEAPDPIQQQTVSWNPGSTAESAWSALVHFLQVVIDIVVAVVVFLGPILIVIGVLGWFAYRTVRRRKTRSGDH